MEESKGTKIIIAVDKVSQITQEDIRDYFKAENMLIEVINSPKGFRVLLETEYAQNLLDKEDDTLKNESIHFIEDDNHCTLYIKGVTEKVEEHDLSAVLKDQGKIIMISIPKGADHKPTGETAFVRFYRKESAIQAAKKFETITINDVELT